MIVPNHAVFTTDCVVPNSLIICCLAGLRNTFIVAPMKHIVL